MSYLEKLIERAVDSEINQENNRIGSYRIEPQHGTDWNYNIYKTIKGRETHIATIGISNIDVHIEYTSECMGKEIISIHTIIKKLYSTHKIKNSNI